MFIKLITSFKRLPLIMAILHKKESSKKYLEEDFQKLEFTLPPNSTAVALKTWLKCHDTMELNNF